MSLINLFDEYGVDFRRYGEHHHVSRNRIATDCPVCSPETKRFRLGWDASQRWASCWSCGKRNPISCLAYLCSVKYAEARELWQSVSNVKIDVLTPSGRLVNPSGVGPLQTRHKRYLASRGLDSSELVRQWGIAGISMHSKLSWRIFIPVFDRFGKPVSWITRSILSHGRRYLGASATEESVPKKSLLYGEHLSGNTIIVVEGPIDAWAIGPGAVALCGVSYTSDQMTRIAEHPRRIICFDREAEKESERLTYHLSQLAGETLEIRLDTGNDPAEADSEEIADIRRRYLTSEHPI